MDVSFDDEDLDRLETDPTFTMNLAANVVKAYRKRMGFIRAAADERDFYAQKSLHFEKLKGKRQHQHSMRLNDQFRLILEFDSVDGRRRLRVVAIEDYH